MNPVVKQKLQTLPDRPGVYVFKGSGIAASPGGTADILYIGKASSLRSRVRSYFTPGSSDLRAFIGRLNSEMTDLETFVTESEKEAALLENQLIKEHQPRYNIKLRDDKEFLSLRLDTSATWPRLEVVRRPRDDGARYFGPYHSATAARQTLRLVNRHFQLRTCTNSEMARRARPCLQYQIRRCPGPCVIDVDRDQYARQVGDVALFLAGRHDELVVKLEAEMHRAAEALEYEQAAVHRDQLRAVDRAREKQRVTAVTNLDQDAIGLYRQGDLAEVAVLQLRGGRLVGVRTYDLRPTLPNDELLAAFLTEWYGRAPVPDEVLLPLAIEAMDGLSEVLSERHRSRDAKRNTKVLAPQRGKRKKLLELAEDNARHAFDEKQRANEDVASRLSDVQRRLRLPVLPRRIECIDVSHSSGRDTVAAIVALENGAPDKKRYRSFHIKHVSGGDDYGAMYEALSRRFARGQQDEAGWELPDLLVVDGGKGQLGVALAALRDLHLSLPLAALAKEKENPLGDKRVDRIYLPGQKNSIPLHSTPALSMLALARDEAHRVSNTLRTKLGKKRTFTSGLDAVRGVGPKTRARLLSALGSLQAIQEASVDELRSAGATTRQAEAIRASIGVAVHSVSERSLDEDAEGAIERAFPSGFET